MLEKEIVRLRRGAKTVSFCVQKETVLDFKGKEVCSLTGEKSGRRVLDCYHWVVLLPVYSLQI